MNRDVAKNAGIRAARRIEEITVVEASFDGMPFLVVSKPIRARTKKLKVHFTCEFGPMQHFFGPDIAASPRMKKLLNAKLVSKTSNARLLRAKKGVGNRRKRTRRRVHP